MDPPKTEINLGAPEGSACPAQQALSGGLLTTLFNQFASTRFWKNLNCDQLPQFLNIF
jgi:hypothetical protein